MARRVLVRRAEGGFDLVEVPTPNEHHLQEVLKAAPQLIPADDLGLEGDLLVVGRETGLASGFIDLLCVARTGDVVLIEFKTGPQNPDFRHALAQVLDYGSDLWHLDVEGFDRGVVQPFLASRHVDSRFRGAGDLAGLIDRSNWDLTEEERLSFDQRLADVLALGDFHFVVAAQRFTPTMRTTLDYLNATMRRGRFSLVEVVQLQGADLVAYAAQVVAAPTARAATSSGARLGGGTDEIAFLAALTDGPYREAMQTLLARCDALGLEIAWRSRGASIRVAVPDRASPVSVGWVLPPGSHWYGARNASFGVDDATVQTVPREAAALARYASEMSGISGSAPVPTGLNAVTFGPETLPAALPDILGRLGELVARIGGADDV